MYFPVYFASHYFPSRYFPGSPVAVKPRYFHHLFFAARFYPDGYFPGDVAVTPKTRYFLHSYFPLRFYADRYFPGDVPVLVPVPPVEPQEVGIGGLLRFPSRFPPIRGRADLRLPAFDLQAFGVVTATVVRGTWDAELPVFLEGSADGQVTAAGSTGTWTFTLPALTFKADGSVAGVAKRTTTLDEAEEQLLMDYLLTMKDR